MNSRSFEVQKFLSTANLLARVLDYLPLAHSFSEFFFFVFPNGDVAYWWRRWRQSAKGGG